MTTAYLHGKPDWRAGFKTQVEDFIVQEDLGFTPSGEGEHIWVHVRKVGQNTSWVAEQLASAAGVSPRQVSWAGLKDRHGITDQWFGIHLPGLVTPDLTVLNSPQLTILQQQRHHKKLRIGLLQGNFFTVRLRSLSHTDGLEQRLTAIAQQGFPNYFGEQRFGHNGNNLVQAQGMFDGKRVKPHQRSLYLSAVRSALFNQVLSARIEQHLQTQILAGDCLLLAGSNSFFNADDTPNLPERLASGDILLSGPLWGRGALGSIDAAAAWEMAVLAEQSAWRVGLEKAGLEQSRRALFIRPQHFTWQHVAQDLILNFFLPAGSYATSLLRELVDCEGARHDSTE